MRPGRRTTSGATRHRAGGRVALIVATATMAAACSTSAASAPSSTEPPPTPTSTTTTTSTTSTTTTSTTVPPTTSSTTSTSTTSTTSSTTTTSTTTTTEPPPTLPPTPGLPGDTAAFDSVIAAATVGRGDRAVGVAVLRDGVVVHEFASGIENGLFGTPAVPASRFRTASISKILTAVAVLQLVEEGRVDLDRPLLEQAPIGAAIVDPRMYSITVRQLLSHTSGLPDAYPRFFAGGASSWQQAAVLGLGDVLPGQPGTFFDYSNTNYCLLGLLIEHVDGRPYEEAVNARVLAPLGIVGPRLAGTFDVGFGEVVHQSGPGRNFMETLGPAGGWVASPAEVGQIVAALDRPDGGLLSPDTVALMRRPHGAPFAEVEWSYGLGLRLFANGSWGHTGTVEHTRAMAVNRPDGSTIVIMVSGEIPWSTDDLLVTIDAAVAAL